MSREQIPCQCPDEICFWDKAHAGCHLRKSDAELRTLADPLDIPASLVRAPSMAKPYVRSAPVYRRTAAQSLEDELAAL